MFKNLTSSRALPSLTGLRAFEAMGRLGSATRAGAELGVTHSAVSRQVKALEQSLGVRLFEGPRHALTLTAEGRRLLADLTPGFDLLAGAVRAVRPGQRVVVAVHASLAVKWLIPRLADFERRHPEVTLQLCDLPVAAVRQREADLVVRFLDGDRLDQPGVTRLAQNRIGLVVAPALAEHLETATRLMAASHSRGWADWEAATGRVGLGRGGRTLSHLHYVLEAVLSGLGAAVLPWTLTAAAVETGDLVAPFGFSPDGGWLAAVAMSETPPRAVRVVTRWLQAQAA